MRYDANKGITIMLVDTNEKFLQYFQQFLCNNLPYNFIPVNNGSLALLKAEEIPVHMFLMETKLTPAVNGFRTLELIRNNEKLSKVPVCFVTAMRDKATAAKAIAAGVDDYLKKPVKESEVLKSIIKLIKKSISFKILIVDNDEKIFPEIKRILALKFPYKVEILTTTSALTGLDIIDEQEIHLLILGNNMHTVNGTRMLGMLESRGKLETLPVIFFPDDLKIEERHQIVDFGIEFFAEKPLRPRDFIETTMQALNVSPIPIFDDEVFQIE